MRPSNLDADFVMLAVKLDGRNKGAKLSHVLFCCIVDSGTHGLKLSKLSRIRRPKFDAVN